MKKNKALLLILAAVFLFSAGTGCGPTQTKILQTFEAAAEKTDALSYINIQSQENYAMTTKVDEEEKVLSSITNTEMQATRNGTALTAFTSSASTTLYGFSLASNVYYKDGTIYSKTMDGKVKISEPTEEDIKPYGYVFRFLRYNKGMLYNASMTEKENGAEISATFAGNEFKQELVAFLPEHYFSTINSDENYLDKLNFSEVKTSCEIANGYISSFSVSFILEINTDGNITSVSYLYNVRFLDPGTEQPLVYPDDLDQYKELA